MKFHSNLFQWPQFVQDDWYASTCTKENFHYRLATNQLRWPLFVREDWYTSRFPGSKFTTNYIQATTSRPRQLIRESLCASEISLKLVSSDRSSKTIRTRVAVPGWNFTKTSSQWPQFVQDDCYIEFLGLILAGVIVLEPGELVVHIFVGDEWLASKVILCYVLRTEVFREVTLYSVKFFYDKMYVPRHHTHMTTVYLQANSRWPRRLADGFRLERMSLNQANSICASFV